MTTSSFRDRLELAVKHAGGVAALSKKAGIAEASIRNYLRGDTEPKGEMIAKLAAGAGVSSAWLFAGKPPMLEVPPPDQYRAEQARPGYAYIPVYNVAAGAANNGRAVHEERVVDVLAFKEDWIRQEVRARPSDLRLIYVEGDSMEPDLRAGDIVMLDHTDTMAKRE
ncbi:MAG: S24 family peptidase, partial [Burkholderiales bacterium]|nr:S24 family peptidase [Burkholderiales bacterium]